MSAIITITLNPAIDKSTSISALVPEKKLACSAPKFEPGGGGINVSRAIKKLGGESSAYFLAGGYTGSFFTELLKKENIQTNVTEIRNHTRENLIVFDESNGQQYRFGMPGPIITEDEWNQLIKKIEATEDISFIVASGSLAPGIPDDIFARIAQIAHQKKAKCIVDTSGNALKKAAEQGLFLIKPNIGELGNLLGKELNASNLKEVITEYYSGINCKNILVSMGAEGAMLVNEEGIYKITPPAVERKSTVGAGDSMVAGVVWSLSNGADIRKAARYGVAAGTAATMNPGTELCHADDVEELYSKLSGS